MKSQISGLFVLLILKNFPLLIHSKEELPQTHRPETSTNMVTINIGNNYDDSSGNSGAYGGPVDVQPVRRCNCAPHEYCERYSFICKSVRYDLDDY